MRGGRSRTKGGEEERGEEMSRKGTGRRREEKGDGEEEKGERRR